MNIFGRFLFGSLAVFFARLHYRFEIKPHAERRGMDLDHVVRAGCLATERCIREAWGEK